MSVLINSTDTLIHDITLAVLSYCKLNVLNTHRRNFYFNNAIYFPHKPEAGEEAHATYKDIQRLFKQTLDKQR